MNQKSEESFDQSEVHRSPSSEPASSIQDDVSQVQDHFADETVKTLDEIVLCPEPIQDIAGNRMEPIRFALPTSHNYETYDGALEGCVSYFTSMCLENILWELENKSIQSWDDVETVVDETYINEVAITDMSLEEQVSTIEVYQDDL